MQVLIPLLIILAVLAVVIYRIYQQHELRKKGEEYNAQLKEARTTRFQFIQATQRTMDLAKEVEHLEERLASLRAELLGYISEFRALLLSIRAHRANSTDSDLDIRTLNQMKLNFLDKWAFANNRKKECLTLRAELAELRASLNRLEIEEREVTNLWKQQKDAVMLMYIELRDRLRLPDPKKYFN